MHKRIYLAAIKYPCDEQLLAIRSDIKVHQDSAIYVCLKQYSIKDYTINIQSRMQPQDTSRLFI